MVCKKCGYELQDGIKFCPQCGEKIENKCPNCGNLLELESRYCPNCGHALGSSIESVRNGIQSMSGVVNHMETGHNKDDMYEKNLDAKAQMEKLGNIISFTIIGFLCLLLYMRNRDSSSIDEIVLMWAVMAFAVFAIYGVIAGVMGFYGAGRYLDKYQKMKQEIGKVEAIKMIEQQYDPTKGFSLMKGGVNTAGGVVSGCFSSIVGFAITIIAIILLMAFC